MEMGIANRRRCRGRAPGVPKTLAIDHVFVQIVLNEEPCTLVLRLILAPNHFRHLRIFLEFGGKSLVRKRVQLLDPDNRHVIAIKLRALFGYVISINTFLQQFYIYAVDFVESGHRVGMRAKELCTLDRLPEDVLAQLGERAALLNTLGSARSQEESA